jgi:hypothetical protein
MEIGVNIKIKKLKGREKTIENLSGLRAAMVFGVISEKTSIRTVTATADTDTALPFLNTARTNDVAVALIATFAALLPISIELKSLSGRLRIFSSLKAFLLPFSTMLFNLILLIESMAASEAEKNADKNKKKTITISCLEMSGSKTNTLLSQPA